MNFVFKEFPLSNEGDFNFMEKLFFCRIHFLRDLFCKIEGDIIFWLKLRKVKIE